MENPWELVAFGALAGIWLAASHPHHGKSRGILGALMGTAALKVVRDAALFEMGKLARSWMDVPEAHSAAPTVTRAAW